METQQSKTVKTRTKEPVVFYVVWHPNCLEGASLATALFEWFHLGDNDISRMGIGVPVYYRSAAEDKDKHRSLPAAEDKDKDKDKPLEIRFDDASLTIVLLLVDKHMVADQKWADYVDEMTKGEQLVNKNEQVDLPHAKIYPVSMDEMAFRIPCAVSSRNFMRIEETADEAFEIAIEHAERRKQKFLREVTELACRLMLYRSGQLADATGPAKRRSKDANIWEDADIPKPINIFISHAKADGAGIAKAMRDYMNQKSQLRPFFDETDLALGFRYAEVLKEKAKRGTAAMIAIYTDSYPYRPWCQTEIKLARKPQNITPESTKGKSNFWWLNPLVVVSALSTGESRCIPEFGQAPVIRWEAGKEREIIGILMRELFFQTYNYLWARSVRKDVQKNPEWKQGTDYLTWIPTIQTLEEIRTAAYPQAWPKKGMTIYHPGESMIQNELLETGMLPKNGRVRSFDEISVRHMRNDLPHDWPKLGISLSTDEQHVARYGYGKEHLHYYLLFILRRLLRCGATIAFGGDLCNCDKKYSETMIHLAQEEIRNHPLPPNKEPQGVGNGKTRRPIFHCFMAWPQGSRLTIDRRAEAIDTCDFLKDIDGCLRKDGKKNVFPPTTDDKPKNKFRPNHEFHRSLSLSKTRYLMTYGTHGYANYPELKGIRARVVLGGKCADFEGIMPGILEEVYWALKRNSETPPTDGVALYIIGGFGGAARLLTDYLLGDVDDVPAWATSKHYENENPSSTKSWRDGFQRLIKDYQIIKDDQKDIREDSTAPWAQSSERLYQEFKDLLCAERKKLRKLKDTQDTLPNGLTSKQNKQLMTSQDISEICALIEQGLRTLAKGDSGNRAAENASEK